MPIAVPGREDKIIRVKAESPAYGGLTIGRYMGKVVMIKGAVPGETVDARIDSEKKDYLTASTVNVLDISPDRVEPVCLHFGLCGGCHLQYMSYQRQVSLKEEVLRECLRRIAKLDIRLDEALTGAPWNYRHRAQFKVSNGKIGFYREKSRDIIEVKSCPLMVEEINEGVRKAAGLLKGMDVEELHITSGESGTALLVKAARGAKGGWKGASGSFLGGGFSGLIIEPGVGKPLEYGNKYLAFGLAGLRYTVSANSFFQGHWRLNQALVKLVTEALEPLAGKMVVDLFSGAGNFSLPIAVHAGEVVAVEESPPAVEDGKRNALANGILNCSFVRSDTSCFKFDGSIDVLVMDPPRTGLPDGVLEKILRWKPGKIAYVSCNPASLSRDLKGLSSRYEIESMRMVDFFPQTYHLEALALLRRK
ncbi:MAG: class I SAM-dependent RNA methyltransferase [Nitrospirota bacterium]